MHQLAVHTIGGVISPSEPLMLIVPQDDALVVEARAVERTQQEFVLFAVGGKRSSE